MCRNIKTLYNFDAPATDDEVRAAATQFVRKITGFARPNPPGRTTGPSGGSDGRGQEKKGRSTKPRLREAQRGSADGKKGGIPVEAVSIRQSRGMVGGRGNSQAGTPVPLDWARRPQIRRVMARRQKRWWHPHSGDDRGMIPPGRNEHV
ncbi:MAG: hypothetical protein A2147_05075 [Chloroflexi bacterium RBG_16_57_8]|nr:MAG: hypothetical protein A2147_05075 [Chloroflexi bacterium RBG_16_57_8]